MTLTDQSGGPTMVVGASRGLGRGIATALAETGVPVIAVARSHAALTELASGESTITAVVADATDPVVAGGLIDRHQGSRGAAGWAPAREHAVTGSGEPNRVVRARPAGGRFSS